MLEGELPAAPAVVSPVVDGLPLGAAPALLPASFWLIPLGDWLLWLLSEVAVPAIPAVPAAPAGAAADPVVVVALHLSEICWMLLTLSVRCSPVVLLGDAALGVVGVEGVVVALPVPSMPVIATVWPTCSLSWLSSPCN